MVYIKIDELEIKPMCDGDEAGVISLACNEMVKQTYMLPDFVDSEQASAFFRRLRDMSRSEKPFMAGIYLQGQFIGWINEVETDGQSIELGYALLPEYHGRGYCTRVLASCIGYMFDTGYECVVCGAFEDNIASIRVMQKCGMTVMDRIDEIDYRGKIHRCVYYCKNSDK